MQIHLTVNSKIRIANTNPIKTFTKKRGENYERFIEYSNSCVGYYCNYRCYQGFHGYREKGSLDCINYTFARYRFNPLLPGWQEVNTIHSHQTFRKCALFKT